MFTMSQRLVFVIEAHGVFCEVYVQGEEAISITEIFFSEMYELMISQ